VPSFTLDDLGASDFYLYTNPACCLIAMGLDANLELSKISIDCSGGNSRPSRLSVWGAAFFDHEIGCVWPVIPQPTERQHVGNQIDAAFILARSHFVNVF